MIKLWQLCDWNFAEKSSTARVKVKKNSSSRLFRLKLKPMWRTNATLQPGANGEFAVRRATNSFRASIPVSKSAPARVELNIADYVPWRTSATPTTWLPCCRSMGCITNSSLTKAAATISSPLILIPLWRTPSPSSMRIYEIALVLDPCSGRNWARQLDGSSRGFGHLKGRDFIRISPWGITR